MARRDRPRRKTPRVARPKTPEPNPSPADLPVEVSVAEPQGLLPDRPLAPRPGSGYDADHPFARDFLHPSATYREGGL